MKRRIANFLKYNKVAYFFYYCLMSLWVNILKIFVKPNNKLIFFNSFAGRKYDDSPRVIFETMKEDPRFSDYSFVWAFHEPDKYMVEGAKIIKTDGINYFKTALSARVWITNSSVERGLGFKGKNTFYLNTWHGSPIKKMGSDISAENKSFKSKSIRNVNAMNTQSYFEAEIFSRCFGIPRDNLIEIGLPRNDVLANYSKSDREKIRKSLGISNKKKILLYCPTFREYEKDEKYGVVMAPPMDLKKWERKLGSEYQLLFRAHYEVAKIMEIKEDEFIRNVTDYPSLNDLMIASDVLLSDYSSIYFDYSIMDKCMLHFSYDYDKYEEKRGMYFDIRKCISGADTEDGVIQLLLNMNYDEEVKKTLDFRNKYMNFYGNAAKQTVELIANKILVEEKQ